MRFYNDQAQLESSRLAPNFPARLTLPLPDSTRNFSVSGAEKRTKGRPEMNPVILLCTVGSSHRPILTALRQTTPDFVCFISAWIGTATDETDSDTQILGRVMY